MNKDYGATPKDMDLINGGNTLVSPDGNTLVSPDGNTLYLPVSSGSSTSLLLVSAAAGTIRHRLSIPVAAEYLKATPDGMTILTTDSQGQATLTNTATNKTTPVKRTVCTNGYMCGLSPDGTVIYESIADNFQLTATDTSINTVSKVKTDAAGSRSIIISPNGTRIALNQGDSIDLINTGRTTQDSSKSSASATPTTTHAHTAIQPLAWIQEHTVTSIGIILSLIAILAILTLLIRHTHRQTATPHHHKHRHHGT